MIEDGRKGQNFGAAECGFHLGWISYSDQLSGFPGTGSWKYWCGIYRGDGDCLSSEYDDRGIAFGTECADAQYYRRSGTVYTGLYGTFSHADLYGGRIPDLQYHVIWR